MRITNRLFRIAYSQARYTLWLKNAVMNWDLQCALPKIVSYDDHLFLETTSSSSSIQIADSAYLVDKIPTDHLGVFQLSNISIFRCSYPTFLFLSGGLASTRTTRAWLAVVNFLSNSDRLVNRLERLAHAHDNWTWATSYATLTGYENRLAW